MLYTTLKLLRKAHACQSGLKTLISSLPENHSEDELIPLSHILKSNGLEHALWALRATTEDSREISARIAIECAWQCIGNFEKKHSEDKRPHTALQTARDFLDGKATPEDMKAAAESALYAAESARYTADSAYFATDSAWYAAESALYAAESARYAAEYALYAAYYARYAVKSACSEQVKIFRRYLEE